MRATATLLVACGLAVATPAAAKSSCVGLTPRLTPASRAADAQLVTRSGQHVAAADISYVLAEPGWRLIWATPKDAERGVFFFRKTGRHYRLVDTWGGVIAPDERAETAKWARARAGGGPSPRLSACFAGALAAGK